RLRVRGDLRPDPRGPGLDRPHDRRLRGHLRGARRLPLPLSAGADRLPRLLRDLRPGHAGAGHRLPADLVFDPVLLGPGLARRPHRADGRGGLLRPHRRLCRRPAPPPRPGRPPQAPAPGRPSLVRLLRRRGFRAILLAAALCAVDALVVEPHLVLFRDDVRIPTSSAPLRIVHLSDLHIASEEPLLRRLLHGIAQARPDVILLSGDLVRDGPDLEPFARHTAAVTSFMTQLHTITPAVYAVQGHSEYQGLLVTALADAGVNWLSNQGVRLGGERPILLLGLSQ